ncbi:MAG TPA: BTAD domain-containing putative transcriptional regulator [Gemmatimonadales bacterium]|jgi:serine/threonine-protein kinase
MLTLELLGTLSLRDESRPVPVAAQQKRPLGLLAILGLGGKPGVSRDRIEAYLWPESSGARAQHALDQTVYAIRHALGGDVIVATGRELRLNPDQVRVDVWEFEQAIRASQWTVAVGHYKGPLLDGFHFAESHELESWIDTNRTRLRLEYQNAIKVLAKSSAKAGDHSQSVTWWRKLANSDPLSAGATKQLMLALAAAGDRAGAVKHARLYQELVRQELEMEPDAEIADLAATLSRQAITEAAAPRHRSAAPVNPSVTPSVATSTPQGKEYSRRDRRVLYAVIGLAILISAGAIWGWMRPAPAKQVVRSTLAIDSAEAMAPGAPWSGRLAISPDGSRLAYIGGPRSQLLIRARNGLHAVAVPGTEGANTPFFSPDGRQVGFLREHIVQIASLSGGLPVTVSDSLTVGTAGASWGPDGLIYVDANTTRAGLLRVEAKPGAKPSWFTVLDTASGEFDHTWPDVLPNGKGVLFTVLFNNRNGVERRTSYAIAVADVPSGKYRVIVNDAMYPRYASSGHLLYVTTNKTLMVVPFDQNAMKVVGEPSALTEGMRLGLWGSADLAVSGTGTLVYATGAGQGKQELVWVTRDGKAQAVDPDWPGDYLGSPALSPDGKWLAVARVANAEPMNIWIKRLDRGPSVTLTLEGNNNFGPAWTPDGRSVTFSSDHATGATDLWTERADGGASAVMQLHEQRNLFNAGWSPDGKWLIFRTDVSSPGSGDILAIRPGIDTAPVPVVATRFTEMTPALSPNGRWLAYVSNETGEDEVYVVPFPNTGAGKWAISAGGGTEPLWSHRGSELFYRAGSGDLVAVEIHTQPRFSLGHSAALFLAAGFTSSRFGPQYAVAPGDRRFLMIRTGTPDKLIVVENWFEELRAKSRK